MDDVNSGMVLKEENLAASKQREREGAEEAKNRPFATTRHNGPPTASQASKGSGKYFPR